MELEHDGNKIQVKGQLYLFGKRPFGVKRTVEEYQSKEQEILEVTHKSYYPGKICYWLKSYGLDSWMVEIKEA